MPNNKRSRRDFIKRTAIATGAISLLNLRGTAATSNLPSMGSNHHICTTCGSQFRATDDPPVDCPICIDERQYVGPNGQQWTTLAEMREGDWSNEIRPLEQDLFGIGTVPKFGIGQRALLVRTAEGNVLWDCISFLDEPTVAAVRQLGGVSAIAISHPHYYSSMVEWSNAFGDVPIYLHEADRQWVQRPDRRISFWEGEVRELHGGLRLIRTGGHFEGFQVMHWPGGASGKGVLLSGDQPQVAADRTRVSFMYSYPNFIPLNKRAIRRIVPALEPYRYERLYGFSWQSVVNRDARNVVRRSAERYLQAISD